MRDPSSRSEFELQPHVPFPESRLWEMQRRYYAERGPAAWSAGEVPHYATSNAFFAQAFARASLGYLRDCFAADPAAPRRLTILEAGGGSGRFAFVFLHKLEELLIRSPFADLEFRYILTDGARANVDFWREHASLRAAAESGRLDFACWDPANPDDALRLERSGEVIAPGSVRGPLLALAGYFFDSLPTEAWYAGDGQLQQWRTALYAPAESAGDDPEDPWLLPQLRLDWKRVACETPADNSAEAQILREYVAAGAERPFSVQFPRTGLKVLRRIRSLGQGPMLALIADKGWFRLSSLRARPAVDISIHGAFSTMVNFHAMGRFAELEGGRAYFTDRESSALIFAGLAFPPQAAPELRALDWRETKLAFWTCLEESGPDDLAALRRGIDERRMHGEELLASVRFGGYDARLLYRATDALLADPLLNDAAFRADLETAVERCWANYFPLGERQDFAFRAGLLLEAIDRRERALDFFQASERLHGPSAAAAFRQARLLATLKQPGEAHRQAQRALELDPDLTEAREFLNELDAE